MSLDSYLKRLKDKGFKTKPLEEPKGYSKQINHLCPCGEMFPRSPAHMLSQTATGVCDSCHKQVKRRNKILDDVDNGYYQKMKDKEYSLPLRRKDYIDRHTPIDHKCKMCRKVFSKAPGKALRTSYLGVCNDCTNILKGEKRRTPKKEFLLKLNEKCPEVKLDRGYVSKTKDAYFICKCGNEYKRKPNKVLSGQFYCDLCSSKSRSAKQSMTIKGHNLKMKERGFKSILLSKEIPNNTTELEYLCECGEPFKRKACHMFKKGSWGVCNKCYRKKSSQRQVFTQSEYDQRLKEQRPGIKRIGKYIDSQTNIQHRCFCGNTDWFPRPNNLFTSFDSCGCIKGTKSEKLIRQIFEHLLQKKFPATKPEFLINPKTKNRLELDGYNQDLALAFEHNGSQHYSHNSRFHKSKEHLSDQRYRDRTKKRLCKKNNVELIVIKTIENKLRKIRASNDELIELSVKISQAIADRGYNLKRSPRTINIDWTKIDRK